jgi:hypothetical protein
LAYSLKKSEKIITQEKREKNFELMTGRKKRCIFSARGIAKNVRKRSNEEERRTERVNCKIKMPIIFIKGSCVATPLYTMSWSNKDGDKGQAMRKGAGAEGGGGVDTRREGLNRQSA